jgi:hypothetical protein
MLTTTFEILVKKNPRKQKINSKRTEILGML